MAVIVDAEQVQRRRRLLTLTRQARYQAKRRIEKRNEGLCASPGCNQPSGERYRCPGCREAHRAEMRRLRGGVAKAA